MSTPSAADTAALLPYGELVAALRAAALDLAAGRVTCPQRQVLQMGEGNALLSMVAVGSDLAVHKLVTVMPRNREHGLPTVQGQVSVARATTGEMMLALEGATVTGRRTAALSMLGVATFAAVAPRRARVYGTGTQAFHHVQALAALYPAARVDIVGRTLAAAQAFCAAHAGVNARLAPIPASEVGADTDLVITCTTSSQPVYKSAASAERLVIAVGAYTADSAEIDATTVHGSTLFVDDMTNARHEAGDLIRAQVDWSQVHGIADAVDRDGGASRNEHGYGAPARAVLFKTVGSAAWDLAAARVAVAMSDRATPPQPGVTNLS